MRGIPQTSLGNMRGAYALAGLGDGLVSTDLESAVNEAFSTGDSTVSVSGPSWLDTLKSLGTSAMNLIGTKETLDAQQQLMQLNIQRAQQGLPPISSSQLAPTVNVGISPEVKAIAIYAAGGLGIAWLASEFMKSRRRSRRSRR